MAKEQTTHPAWRWAFIVMVALFVGSVFLLFDARDDLGTCLKDKENCELGREYWVRSYGEQLNESIYIEVNCFQLSEQCHHLLDDYKAYPQKTHDEELLAELMAAFEDQLIMRRGYGFE